jgi:tetratricopeptide (TPR) repeat protein
MKFIQISLLILVCLVNLGWTTKDVSRAEEKFLEGYEAWKSGSLSEARDCFEEVLMLKPRHIEALNYLGVVYEEMGFSEKAEEKYLSALTLNRDYLPAYANLGFLYWNQGELEKSRFYFEKRIRWGSPRDPWTVQSKSALKKVIAQQELEKLDALNEELD